ncbi:MAG: hypothetical protein ACM3SU_10655 [Acidobacteriota bacterium]
MRGSGASWAWRILPAAVLCLTGVAGFRDGVGTYREAATAGQKLTTVAELGYGVVSVIALTGLLAGRAWARPVMILWAALATTAAAAATVAWGGEGIGVAAVAGVSTAAFCGLMIWMAFRRPRPRSDRTARPG